ncbi:hypothetical protein SY85_04015 [Flavisolibacter tropicus]|uniref:Uncharacterized protein n=2 Tax=Flavisolibacter tropicus TaxID=1492898 RepID=A0A172TSP3_9BACT|nr:hypothetical protein SY85_04015 [Flavisolibacter tropicus]
MYSMADWRLNIDDFLKGQGFERKEPDLTHNDAVVIQEFLENIGRPVFENITDQLNAFKEVKAEVVESSFTPPLPIDYFHLSVFNRTQPKLTYRLRFTKEANGQVMLGAEYSTPNIYGENTRFHNSALNRTLTGTTEEDIASDFFQILQTKF